ncbi:MAG TPA: hypothetical protein PLU22_11235 [Polyangiaceae bacterium]|nr:hypothetical protein [Polyangiaceae bacterium]
MTGQSGHRRQHELPSEQAANGDDCSCLLALTSANGAAGSSRLRRGLSGLLRRRRRSMRRGGI